MRALRTRALVCLVSFCLGLFSAGVGPVMAQVNMSPGYRATEADTLTNPMQNPYYRAATTPYFNPQVAQLRIDASTPMGNASQRPGYYDPALDASNDPRLDQRYNNSYGNRYQGSYYGNNSQYGQDYQLPGVLGAVAGLALGAASFGMIGAILGGLGGFFLGRYIGRSVLKPTGYGNSAYGYGGGTSKVPVISGIIGALAGAFIVSGMGPLAMLIAGTAGFMLARFVVRMMMPQQYYYGFQRPGAGTQYPYNTYPGTNYYAPVTTEEPPKAAESTEESDASAIPQLKSEFYQAMRDYKSALVSDDETAKAEARQHYLARQKAYFDAKNQVFGGAQ